MAGPPVFLAGIAAGIAFAAAVAWALAGRARRLEASRRSALAHDLRTPLSSITAFAEILQDDATEGERYLAIIRSEAERLERMIGQRLDARPASRSVPGRREPPAPADGSRPERRVLIVDDDRYLVEATRTLLSRAGFRAIGAVGGEEGLRQARVERPDLIVMDLMMPDLPGTEALKRLRSDPATREIPVIITTGAEAACAPDGAAAILTKPISLDALLDAVRKAIPGER